MGNLLIGVAESGNKLLERIWMDALPAVELLKKFVEPPSLKIDTLLPAVALLKNLIVPKFPEASATVINV